MNLLPESLIVLQSIHDSLPATHQVAAKAPRKEGYSTPWAAREAIDYLDSKDNMRTLHAFPLVGDMSVPEMRRVTGRRDKQLLVTLNHLTGRKLLIKVGMEERRGMQNRRIGVYRRNVRYTRDMLHKAYPEKSDAEIERLFAIEQQEYNDGHR